MFKNKALQGFSAIILCSVLVSVDAAESIDEIVVTADFRGRLLQELPASIQALEREDIEQLATQHFEELVAAVPNLNWSGDGHRARYFQIRGVGELEQYQGAPNPSVGFLVDDIDFSGIGTIASLFDVERIEVLRGPQGSRYGANALGGLIYMQSALPSAERNGLLTIGAGDDDAASVGLAFGGALTDSEQLLFRLSAHQHRSNGFRDNPYLRRNDTNGRDETSVRTRLRWLPRDSVTVDVAAFYSAIDNGYDAFALDNSYTVLSNRPGQDAQDSLGASAKLAWDGPGELALTSITAFANSDIDFSYDADWGNTDSWAPVLYDYISLSDRRRRTLSQELRLESSDDNSTRWLLGAYAMRLEDDLRTDNQGEYYDPFYDFADSLDVQFDSAYEATNLALFGQLEHAFSSATRLNVGLRLERRLTDYADSDALNASPGDSMLGGELSLSQDIGDSSTAYAGLSRGFKAGGFNLGIVPAELRSFDSEALWNVEVGLKSLFFDGALSVNSAAFYNLREDQQVRVSYQLVPNDPTSFGFVTVNAERATGFGLESDLRWYPSETVELYASLGLLSTEFDEFTLAPQLEGRAQAHAPAYSFAAGGRYSHPSGWFVRVDVAGKDEFYFDVSHDRKSDAYSIANARIGFAGSDFTAQLWMRNLFDEEYAVRGFFFGNEPPDFPATLYTRLGDPRQFGFTFEKRFGS
jgi:outer membrane receptor protein involved in Fe transport